MENITYSVHRTRVCRISKCIVLAVLLAALVPNAVGSEQAIHYTDSMQSAGSSIVTLPSTVHHNPDSSGHNGEAGPKEAHVEEHGAEHHGEEHHGIHVFVQEFSRVEIPFIIALWIFCASLAKIGFHMAPKLSSIFPESCLLIVVGIVIGLLLFHTQSNGVQPLTPTTFFLYMLPPIILDAGYFMPNRLFFDHLGTILLFAVIGTIWNTCSIGLALWGCGLTGVYGFELPLLDTFLFSALISAVDPVAVLAVFEEIHVNEVLYIVVFGESLLNDAVTVVLYNMFDQYVGMGLENIRYTDALAGLASFLVVAVGGTLIGIIWGFLTGFVTRFTNHVRVIEPIFIFVMSYLAYLNAEIFHMSGILAITFCGITMKNYVEANISSKSHTTIKYAMKMLSGSSETIIFMFLGVNTVNDAHDWNTAFILLTILFCSVFRAIGVVVLTELANRFRLHKLDRVEKFVMSYGGLRGAVAFALVLLVDKNKVKHQPLFVTATISVVFFTVFFQGITIKPLVKFLKVKRANKREKTMNERIHEKMMDYTMAGMEDILGHMGNLKIRDKFKQINNKYIRPFLIREYVAHEPKILETYSKLTMKDAVEYMRRNGSTMFNTAGNSESMGVLFRNYTANNFSSSANIVDQEWNLDIGELAYSPSARDLGDAKVHHLLSEELWKPYRRSVRRLSYSRHTVNDRDLSSSHLNHNMHMHIRRMVSETVRKQHSKRMKRNRNGRQDGAGGSTREGSRAGKTVTFEALKENGTTKKLHDDHVHSVIKEVSEAEERGSGDETSPAPGGSSDDLESEGIITFTARKPSTDEVDPVLFTYQSAIAQLMHNQQIALAGFLAASAMAHLPVQPELTPLQTPELPRAGGKSPATGSKIPPSSRQLAVKRQKAGNFRGPAATGVSSTVLEQARIQQQRLRFVLERHRESLKRVMSIVLRVPTDPSRLSPYNSRRASRSPTNDIDSAWGGEGEPPQPTAVELQLPWKRVDENDASTVPVIQSEFPLWVENKEYTHYYSPTNTFLGDLERRKSHHPTVVEIFNPTQSDDQTPSASAAPPFVTVTIPEENSKESEHAKKSGRDPV